ncbi:MAG: BON domain-containing protein [Casimicrobiaceae bacterium]
MFKIPAISFAALLVAAGLVTAGLPAIGTDVQKYHRHYHDSAIVSVADRNAPDPFREAQGEAADAAITANVKDAIANRVGPGAAEINVETRAAIVTLTGTAPSAAIRILIREAAWTVGGVVEVVDNLEVRSTA